MFFAAFGLFENRNQRRRSVGSVPAAPTVSLPLVNKDVLKSLIDRFDRHPKLEPIRRALSGKGRARLYLKGLRGAQDAFLLAALARSERRTFVLIAADKEEAAYLQNDLAALLPDWPVHFLPDSFKRPRYFAEVVAHQVQERTEVINQLTHAPQRSHLIVTYPEALLEQVVRPDAIEQTRIVVRKGERLDLDFLVEVLNEYGFSREDFVYEPGQYSIRGGIVDLFSFGNDYPYRIELFDDEVESIRSFDPMSQLSVRPLESVHIIPNVQTRFGESQKAALTDILPEGTLVWIKDAQMLRDRLVQTADELAAFAADMGKLPEEEQVPLVRDGAFADTEMLIAGLERCHLALAGGRPGGKGWQEVAFAAKPQPSFNKNFSLLIDHLRKQQKSGFETFLFAENPRQLDRLEAIFHDLDAQVQWQPVPVGIHAGFVDEDLRVACYTDHQIFQRFHRYKLRKGFTKDKALNLKLLRELKPGDYVVHIDHGVGRFSGLQKLEVNGHVQECVRIFYANDDVLYVGINSLHKLSKYSGAEGHKPRLNKLGSDAWQNLKRRTKKKVKDIAAELIKLYARRKASEGHAFPPDDYLQHELEASFIYEDTPDQLKATREVKEDMMKPYPMDRLVCGDVGFGKTEVAIRAAFKAVSDGKQVAVLVPTTILALQHYKTFAERLREFDLRIDYLNRFKTAAQKREIYRKLAAGELDIIIGTHALLNKQVRFKDLGLLVIDEEQKFGVAAKEKLRQLKVNVDTLTLTATPIPRTLQFSLMAARDLSIIRTPPPNRQPIHTEIRVFHEALIKEAIYYEVQRGGQVFFVHNRVKTLPQMVELVRRLCPDVEVAMAHGQMDSKTLEKTLVDFIERRYDVLVCTNIIETGLDIPNANTMLIHNAHQFGLSDLHQLRGRIGRSNKKAFCYLLCPPMSVLTPEARKRLRTIEEFSELGSGFEIAMRDLDIRGAGNLLGAEQSGFINEVGYETFQRILDEAIQELKEEEFRELFAEEQAKKQEFVREVQIETDTEMHIPDEYVANVQERLLLYQELDRLEDEEQLQAFAQKLRDRFGRLPAQVEELFDGLRLRWTCRRMGIERVVIKGGKMVAFFISNPQSPFYDSALFAALFRHIGAEGHRIGFTMKKTARHLMLVRNDVQSLTHARKLLHTLYEGATAEASGVH